MINIRIGILLGWQQIKKTSRWTSALIVSVVTFTMLNIVFIGGILTGITDGLLTTVRNEALSDIIIEPLPNLEYIKDTERILNELKTYSKIESFTPRFEDAVTIEANYKDRRDLSDETDIISVNVQGIDPELEDKTLKLSSIITEGEYLDNDDRGYILIGKHYVDRYQKNYGNVYDSLSNIYPGSVVRLSNGLNSKEFIVKGIVDSKIDLVSLNVYISEIDFRRFFEKKDYNANQILIRLKDEKDGKLILEQLNQAGFNEISEVRLFKDDVPKYVKDVTDTFDKLSLIIGGISIIVASLTVFITIFINTLTRKRQIGILKAIGIKRKTLEYAYITQAVFYSVIGIGISIIILFAILIPYFNAHPIDFPYTDIKISVPPLRLVTQITLLLFMTYFSGLLSSRLIIRQNTLDSILGRNNV